MVAMRVEETACPVVYVNLVGGQDELVFDGGSFVLDQSATTVVRAPAYKQGLYPVDFAITQRELRPIAGQVTPRDDELASTYQALVLGVRDYIDKNGFNGVVIGLSA